VRIFLQCATLRSHKNRAFIGNSATSKVAL
jgi:hypothetical protein